MSTPHEALFRSTFAVPFHAAGWLQSVLPEPLVAAIDWTSLQPAREHAAGLQLSGYPADAVFTARMLHHDRQLLLVLEHKSSGNQVGISQVLRYAVHLRSALRDADTGCEPLVVSVLLHHGDALVGLEDPVRSLQNALAAVLGPLQPCLGIVVDDLSTATETELRRPGLTPCAQLTLLALRFLRHLPTAKVIPAIRRWGDLLRAVQCQPGPLPGSAALESFACYAIQVTDVSLEDLAAAFTEHLQQPNDMIMTTGQRLRSQGHAEGLVEGRVEGRVDTLRRLLQVRFGELPPDLLHRLQHGSEPELERWTERLLGASSLAELFAE
ncbi:MAG: Rpn family recombination-promoting nuclease/putative transposase [Planctomycetes bacterium]|nr:Rpn family recombination-promoting nuclease/putative transposase [Planctomycetota bacterium]